MSECRRGHRLTGSPLDTLPDGDCRECDRQYQAKYKARRRLAMALLHAAEDRGLSGGEAISVLRNVDYWTLQDCQSAGIR